MAYSYSDFLEELGRRLRKLRIERGWTLRHMITVHGFHLAHWQGFEKGKGMSIPSLLRICDVFGVKLEDLIAGVGWVESVRTEPVSKTLEEESDEPKDRPATSSQSPVASPRRSPRRKR